MALVMFTITETGDIASAGTGPSVDSFLAGYFQAGSVALSSSASAAQVLAPYFPTGSAATNASTGLAGYEATTANEFHSYMAGNGDNLKSVSTAYTIDSVSVSASGQQASVNASTTITMKWSPPATPVTTKFTAAKVADMATAAQLGEVFGPDDRVTTLLSTSHTMSLVLQGGVWKIASDLYVDPFNQSLSPDHITPSNGAVVSGTPSAGTAGPNGICYYCYETYNRTQAVSYADTWARSYNPAYQNFNNSGGDCTNFVSQALHDSTGGGLVQEAGYWYFTPSYSYDWVNSGGLKGFTTANPNGSNYNFGWLGTSGSWSATNAYAKSSMLRGDLIFYDWTNDGTIDHAVIVAAYQSDGTPLIDQHSIGLYHSPYDLNHLSSWHLYMVNMNNSIGVP